MKKQLSPVRPFWPILLSVIIPLVAACTQRNDYHTDEGMAWNTIYHITYNSPRDFSDSIRMIFNDIDLSVSAFNDSSTVSLINRNRTAATDVHFRNVYRKSLEINEMSYGMFDPTLAPLIRAWGFGQGHTISADTLRLDSLLDLVGIRRTELRPDSLYGDILYKENPGIEFNFSALAKGYGVDCIADMLERNGVEDYLVEVGGEIRASGVNRQGKPWTIGIDMPLPDEQKDSSSPISTISITDIGLATSGNYRNYQSTSKSGTFGHTISPITGRPVTTDLASVTIIVPAGYQSQTERHVAEEAFPCMTADAIATACMTLGLEESQHLCTRLRIAALFITTDLRIISNPAYRALTQ